VRQVLATTPAQVLDLDTDAARWHEQPAQNLLRSGVTPAHLAYVIYTSGSTDGTT